MELVDRYLKTVGSYLPATQKDEVIDSVEAEFQHWTRQNETLRRLCAII
jgi:hypothetical protein